MTSIVQTLNYFRDMDKIANFEKETENSSQKVAKKVWEHADRLLYNLDNIVKQPQFLRSIY